MANFLNTDGLSALWAKIKSKFYTKAEVDVLISCATTDEIEEMCDALGFMSVTINTNDYREQESKER